MILRTNRGALLLVALLGFAVGLAVSLRVDIQKSEAINLFGGSEKPAARWAPAEAQAPDPAPTAMAPGTARSPPRGHHPSRRTDAGPLP
jgi:hypothetical protein